VSGNRYFASMPTGWNSICVTAQHRAMLDQVLDVSHRAASRSERMREGRRGRAATSRILAALEL